MNNWEPILKLVDFFGKPAWWDLYGPGDANAPTLYDIDKDGYITGPSGGRSLYPGEQENINKYNDLRSGLNNDQRKALDNFLKDALPISWPNDPGDWDKDFDVAQKTVSPIVLDLDGDGVETIALTNGAYGGAHFNLDAKGLAEQTGWAGKDDGILVRDLNGDGKITSGRELFGNHSLLKNGMEATNGFQALKELDSNGDGVVDSTDTAFASLQVWKDSNGDGVTDAGELLSLSEAGVKNLKVGYTNSTATDAQGNQHQQLGSFTRTDGRTQQMDDVWFAVDAARTVNRDLLAVSASIQALPELAGMGNVRSLHQAMALDASGQLQALVSRYIDPATTFVQRDTLIDPILYRWAGVQNVDPTGRGPYMDGRQLAVLEALLGRAYFQYGGGTYGPTINDPGPFASGKLLALYDKVKSQINATLELQTIFLADLDSLGLQWHEDSQTFEWDVSTLVTGLQTQYAQAPQEALLHVERLGQALATDTYAQKLLQAIQQHGRADGDVFSLALLHMGGGQFFFNGTAGNDSLTGNSQDNCLTGGAGNDTLLGGEGADIYMFNRGDGQDRIQDRGTPGTGTHLDVLRLGAGIGPAEVRFSRAIGQSQQDLTIDLGAGDRVTVQSFFDGADYRIEQIQFADGTQWGLTEVATRSVQSGTGNADSWSGLTDYANRMNGLGGNDTLYGGNQNDTLEGGDGNDALYGYAGTDILSGGIGNDSLNGSYGNDIYVFNLGDGQDTLIDYDYTTANVDTLQLGAGLDVTNIQVGRSGNDLVFSWSGNSTDQVKLQNFFYSAECRIEKLSFADGTQWSLAEVAAKLVQNGTANAESWGGLSDYANRMNGLGGDDYPCGGNQNDTLDGGDGNDTLYGYAGNDTLGGGTGADTLYGGYGNDIYVFNPGDGQDTLSDYEYMTQNADTLQLGAGLDVTKTQVGRSGYDLVLSWSGNSTDQVKLQNYFYSSDSRIEKLSFADGTQWSLAEVAAKLVQNGTANAESWGGLSDFANRMNGLGGDDYLYGGNQNDTLDGGDGNDALYGNAGNDTLMGGAGNDTLYGGSGADSFVFNTTRSSSNIDTVIDFSAANGDKLMLNSAVFDKLTGLTDLTNHFRSTSQVAVGNDDYIAYNSSTGELFYDASGNGSAVLEAFAKLDNRASLSGQQFLVL